VYRLTKKAKNKANPDKSTGAYELSGERPNMIYPFWSTPIIFIANDFITTAMILT
jgi:short subunit fatty acids transporter